MKRSVSRWVLAIALVAVAGAPWWLLHGAGRAAPEAERASPRVAPRASDAGDPAFAATSPVAVPISRVAPLAPGSDALSDASVLAAESDAPAILSGRITRAVYGTPAPGVPVYALVEIDGRRIRPPLDEAASAALTDADGRYRLVFTQACTVTQLRALPGPDSVRGQRDADLALVPGTQTTLDLAVGRGGAISGRVVDMQGRPVPGASVVGWTDITTQLFEDRYKPDRTTVADGAGEFVLEGLGPPFVISAEALGYTLRESLVGTLPEGERLGLKAGGALIDPPLSVVLSPARKIHGLVLGPDGTPVANARVYVDLPDLNPHESLTAVPDVFHALQELGERRTDDNGRLVLSPIGSETCTVIVSAQGYAEWRGSHAAGDPDLAIRMDKGSVLTGRVTDAESQAPIRGAEIILYSADHEGVGTMTHTTRSNAEGRFELAGLAPDPSAELDVEAAGHAIFVEQALALTDTGPNTAAVVLDPERVLAGTVVDAAGAPVPGAIIEIEGDRVAASGYWPLVPVPTWESHFDGLDRTEADDQGRFHLGRLYDGSFKVTARDPRNSGLIARLTARAGSEDLRLVLGPDAIGSVTLVGTATDALTGRPVTTFSVTPHGIQPFMGEVHPFESAEGVFRITGLQPGEMRINAQAPGYAEISLPVRTFEAGEQHVDLRFTTARVVRLRVLDRERAPARADVSFRSEGGASLMVSSGPNSRSSSIHTDGQGEALAIGLPAQSIMIDVRRNWSDPGETFPLDLSSEPHGTVELVLQGEERVGLLVVALGAAPSASLPASGSAGADTVRQIAEQLKSGLVWQLDVQGVVRAVGADGKVCAEAKLEALPPAGTLVTTDALASAATRSAVARLLFPKQPLRITVDAPGYAPFSETWSSKADPESGEQPPLIVLLHRK